MFPVMLLMLLMLLGGGGGAPAGREVYRMPQSALRALSDRGTVVLEAALASALSALEKAASERSRAEAGCRGCAPCLFQDCGRRSGPCTSPGTQEAEPSCELVAKAQSLSDEGEQSWALSQACGYYQRRCPPGELGKEGCVRVMGESCSARVLQCSLLNTMQNLEPVTQTRTEAVCGQRLSVAQNQTQPRSRIVGGSPASPGSWPWLVNLQLDGVLMCGGVLVDSSWVVTAAHCFAGSYSESYWTAVVGEFDITRADPDEQIMKVNRIMTHPKFNPKTFNNDIALVELNAPVMLSEYVTPVCLPSALEPPVGTPCLVAGWGSLYEDGPSADIVMEAKVPLLPQSTCKSSLGKELVTNTMFCAGYLSGGIDSCQGDSGGPLIYQDRMSGRFQLYGITSWGDGCGEKGKPGVYTRVTAFSDWIQSEIEKSYDTREPTCLELLKTSDLSEDQQSEAFSSICQYYMLSCPPSLSPDACGRLAHDKCHSRFKKCQLHSFLQTLLDLLQRAEDYIRDKVDLTFFTQTLPQLVEHIYSTAFSNRERRQAPSEQIDGTASPAESALHPPSLFREVGPLVEDWANFLRNLATKDLDWKPESNLFLQTDESAVHQLDGEYRALILLLNSKLDSRTIPSIPPLDSQYFEDELPLSSIPKSVTTLLEPFTMLSGDGRIPASSPSSSIPEERSGPSAETTASTLLPGSLSRRSSVSPMSQSDERAYRSRRRRRDLNKRQMLGLNDKACPGVAETVKHVEATRQTYSWVLGIPSQRLGMSFQEVLVDLTSKNERGLYQARVRAAVGGRPLTFYCLVGLENESFYRSMPRIIALALDGLRT
ncbi:serine protease 56 [Denticeps clupeoides]|uniref:serine protease 56 n=1 Tax=Denticeps clupeoides TaxID=299321 RepID=UPI0010A56B21|nr:serine protease 56 [Denticeps clupeoides]